MMNPDVMPAARGAGSEVKSRCVLVAFGRGVDVPRDEHECDRPSQNAYDEE
jgi:hypothetical protein